MKNVKRVSYRGALCTIMFAMLLASTSVRAQDEKNGNEGVLTLTQAITYSLKSSNRYKIAREKVKESKYKVREAWGKLWPDLSSEATATWWGADKGIQSMSYGVYDIKFIKCSIALNPGLLYNGIKASMDEHAFSVNDERTIKLDTTLQAIRFYYKILLSAEIIKLRTDSIKALEENLRVVTAGYKIGSFTKLDYLRAKVSTANEKTRLINAQNDHLSAIAALNTLMGKGIDAPVEPDGKALAVASGEEETYAKWTEKQCSEKLVAMIADSFTKRPELIKIKSKKEGIYHGAKANESVYLWPTFFASVNYGMNKSIQKDSSGSTGDHSADLALKVIGEELSPPGWNKNWSVILGASYHWGGWAPFSSAHAKTDQLFSKEAQADMEIDDFVRSLSLDIQLGLFKLISASNAIRSQKENIESAEESLRVSIIQFKNGMIDNTKFLDTNVELSNARTMYIQGLYDLQSAKAELNRAVGYDYFSY